MSSSVEERRTQEIHEQKKLAEQKTAKEKEAAALKFKTTMAGQQVAKQKTESQQKETQQRHSFNQNLMMARQGIAGRNLAERLVKNQEQSSKYDKELSTSRDKDLQSSSERAESDAQDTKSEAKQQAQQFDGAIAQRDDEQKGQQDQQQQGQNQQSTQQQSQGQGQPHDQGHEESTVGALAAAAKKGAGKADKTQTPTKIAIGKTQRAAAAEKIPQQVLSGVVDKVAVMCTQGMTEFQIQLKDDAMGGGTLRVSLKDKKLKIAFTLKDSSMKALLESQKGLLMRMFERKGLALESMTVQLRT